MLGSVAFELLPLSPQPIPPPGVRGQAQGLSTSCLLGFMGLDKSLLLFVVLVVLFPPFLDLAQVGRQDIQLRIMAQGYGEVGQHQVYS